MDDKKITLRELLNLTEEEIDNSKIALCSYSYDLNKNIYDIWFESNQKDISYAYYNSDKQKNYKVGQTVFAFVQFPENNKHWVLVSVGKILESSSESRLCKFEPLKKYDGMIGRLRINLATGKRFGFVYNLSTYIDKAEVIAIDDKNKEIVKFKGFNEVTLSYKDVETILNNPSCDYYKILEHIKGIYCLTDTFTGKLYIGSATGKDGIAGRWKDYIITQDGGNKELISLKEKECGDYFKKNIKFVLIEFFDISISDEYIKQRERYWKKAFETVKNGYNDNY